MRLVNSRVESIGPDEQDPSSLAIRLDSASGLANPSLKIARDQMEGFLAILGVEREEDLIGRSVRVTVDDEKGSEQIAFLTPAEQAQAVEPIAALAGVFLGARQLPAIKGERSAGPGLQREAHVADPQRRRIGDLVAERVRPIEAIEGNHLGVPVQLDG